MNKLGSTRVHNVVYQVSRSSAFRLQRKISLMFFTIYGHGGHLCHVDHLNKLSFPHPMKFGFIGPSGLIVLNLRDSDQGQSMTLTFGTQSFMYSCSNIESERF